MSLDHSVTSLEIISFSSLLNSSFIIRQNVACNGTLLEFLIKIYLINTNKRVSGGGGGGGCDSFINTLMSH